MRTTALTWEIVDRGSSANVKERFIGVRKNGFLINARFFYSIHGAEKNYKFVQIKRSREKFFVMFEFLTALQHEKMMQSKQNTDAIYPLARDGGAKDSRSKNGCAVFAGRVVQQTPWLKAICDSAPYRRRRFMPIETESENIFLIEIMPSFAHHGPADSCELGPDAKGIYCFDDVDGNTLYIGQGIIRRRFQAHQASKTMNAAVFRWSIEENEELRLKAEGYHLALHVAQHGKLPEFNLVAGRKKAHEPNT